MKCIACGAEIEFSPKNKKLKCSYCGSEFDAKEYREQMTTAKKKQMNLHQQQENKLKQKHIRANNVVPNY